MYCIAKHRLVTHFITKGSIKSDQEYFKLKTGRHGSGIVQKVVNFCMCVCFWLRFLSDSYYFYQIFTFILKIERHAIYYIT